MGKKKHVKKERKQNVSFYRWPCISKCTLLSLSFSRRLSLGRISAAPAVVVELVC